jgi:AAA domain
VDPPSAITLGLSRLSGDVLRFIHKPTGNRGGATTRRTSVASRDHPTDRVQTALHCNIWTELAADPWLTADAWYAVQDAGLMALHIVTADERLAEANSKTTVAIFGQPGIGKTSLLWTLLASTALCIDLEAGMNSVEDWPGDSIPIRTWPEAVDIACLIGGVDPSADPSAFLLRGHYQHVAATYPDLVTLICGQRIIFVDSISELTRQCMAWAKTRPEAFSDKTGKPDVRGAYGLLAREVIALLKNLQHAPGKTVIFVGVLERIVDEFNREH